MALEPKPSSDSAVTLNQLVLPFHANVAGNMHGGEVMKMMDSAAGVVATRHSSCNTVTASVTNLAFIEPIFVGDLVICSAELTYTGTTSMEVHVCVKAEDMKKGTTRHVLEGYFFMVALNPSGHPAQIAPLLIENEKQAKCMAAAKQRIEMMKEAARKNSPSAKVQLES